MSEWVHMNTWSRIYAAMLLTSQVWEELKIPKQGKRIIKTVTHFANPIPSEQKAAH